MMLHISLTQSTTNDPLRRRNRQKMNDICSTNMQMPLNTVRTADLEDSPEMKCSTERVCTGLREFSAKHTNLFFSLVCETADDNNSMIL